MFDQLALFCSRLITLQRRNMCKSHYDILGLKQNCTEDEIKKAFIELSKKYHPDMTQNDTHNMYLKIMEAYKILGKRRSRIDYDLTLPENNPYSNVRRVNVYSRSDPYYNNETRFRDPYSDPSFFKNRDKSEFTYKGPYYGIKGIDRFSNGKFVVILCALAIFFGTIKTIAMNSSFSTHLQNDMVKSMQAAEVYNEVRSKAAKLTLEEQINNLETENFRKTE